MFLCWLMKAPLVNWCFYHLLTLYTESSFWLLGQIIRNSTCECMFPNRPNLLSLPEFRWANTPPQKRRKIWINGLRVEATQQRQPITIQDASSEVGISHSVCSQYKVVCSCWHLGSGQKMRSLKYVYVSKQWPEPAVRRRKQVWFGTKKIVSKDTFYKHQGKTDKSRKDMNAVLQFKPLKNVIYN